jgi:hypothetical protein
MTERPETQRPQTDRIRLHTALVIGLSICAVGFIVELQRGLDGHLPAWVYVIEWPLFGVGGAFVWWRLLRDEADASLPEREPEPSPGVDPGLDAWRDYVVRLESKDEPAGD